MIKGIQIDEAGRCFHYHSIVDIVALKCSYCQQYYACYKCHDSLNHHPFKANSSKENFPVLCGLCREKLTLSQYKEGFCYYCKHSFNPNCSYHHSIYFAEELSS